jgi:hypothetical protein
MLNEKPGNDFHWKSKLDEMESLPGETFNKEAAWEKLHKRMQGKSANKSVVWYWAAAACLLMALIIPLLFLTNKKESVIVKNNSVEKQTQSSSHLLPPGDIDTSVIISSMSAVEKLPAQFSKENNKINSSINLKAIPVEAIAGKTQKEEYITQKVSDNAAVPVDTAISIVANLPEKKKLKVVHINELGDPVTEIPNVARNYEHHSFQVKFLNQEVYTSPSHSGNTGFNIFKTKNPPSN